MRNSIYPPGNRELLTLLERKPFDRKAASLAIKDIADINQPILDNSGHPTTYLFAAQSFNNVDGVRFLFENGADPNFNDDSLSDDCPLYDLHFLFFEMENEAQERLEIVSLFFEYGADPNLIVDGETIYDHVIWEVFDPDAVHGEEYLLSYFKRLLAYGGGGKPSSSRKPKFTEPIDTTRIDEYQIQFVKQPGSNHEVGHLLNPDGIDIGTFA